ncbi:MAG: BatD family protein, partial [Ginsengibacter sp.]
MENASNVENISPPSFSHFDVVGGPNQQSGMSSINGKIDQYISVSFYLKPRTTGNFTIASARARIHGKDYFTNPLTIKVTNASNPAASGTGGNNSLSPFSGFGLNLPTEPTIHQYDDYILKKGENVNEKVHKNLFVRLDLNKTNCFVGEPIVASYKLYTRLRSESMVTEAPSFNGFSVSDLDVNSNAVQTEKFNGREYNVYTLRKVQLYPLQPGTITLDPVVTDNDITFLRSEYAGNQKGDMFFDMLQDFANSNSPDNAVIKQHVTLKSKATMVTVYPLPDSVKPVDFKGAVGNFTISSSLDRKSITTDDMGNLRINITGEGNIQLVNALKIEWPANIEGYDTKVSDDVDKFSVPMKGNKTFIYPFTVSSPGTYTIPEVSFSYFDPVEKSYKTLHTQPVEINVKKGKGYTEGTYVKNAKEKDRGQETAF